MFDYCPSKASFLTLALYWHGPFKRESFSGSTGAITTTSTLWYLRAIYSLSTIFGDKNWSIHGYHCYSKLGPFDVPNILYILYILYTGVFYSIQSFRVFMNQSHIFGPLVFKNKIVFYYSTYVEHYIYLSDL